MMDIMTTQWRTPKRCSKGCCVELKPLWDGGIAIRSTRQPDLALCLPAGTWAHFLAKVKTDTFA